MPRYLSACLLLSALAVALTYVSASTGAANVNPKLTDKLVELVMKHKYDEFVTELAKDGMDSNQPDSHGRLPLMEAVKTRNVKFVDALIQFGAFANSKDPATGTAPLQVAFQHSSTEIARLLLKYGADVNTADKGGAKPRDYAPSEDISKFIKLYDAEGSMGFEDAPGSWTKSMNENGESYWYNPHTKESRWDTPPSCAWQRVELQGHPNNYVNSVTGQRISKLPKALAWRLVNKDGKDVWFNWGINISQYEEPVELSTTLLQEAKKHKNLRWYNPKTKEFSWEDPRFHTPWRALISEEEGHNGQTYYYNVNTGEATWEVPEDLAWQQITNKEDGKTYWYNAKTGESTWDTPDLQIWERHETEL